MSEPKCFLDKSRECNGECMAFVHIIPADLVIQCGILMNLNALSEIRDTLKGKTSEGVHPISAPPPEVKA